MNKPAEVSLGGPERWHGRDCPRPPRRAQNIERGFQVRGKAASEVEGIGGLWSTQVWVEG